MSDKNEAIVEEQQSRNHEISTALKRTILILAGSVLFILIMDVSYSLKVIVSSLLTDADNISLNFLWLLIPVLVTCILSARIMLCVNDLKTLFPSLCDFMVFTAFCWLALSVSAIDYVDLDSSMRSFDELSNELEDTLPTFLMSIGLLISWVMLKYGNSHPLKFVYVCSWMIFLAISVSSALMLMLMPFVISAPLSFYMIVFLPILLLIVMQAILHFIAAHLAYHYFDSYSNNSLALNTVRKATIT